MKVLFDQGTPVPLRKHLRPHRVDTAAEMGWSQLQNGALLRQAVAAGHEVFVTTDQNLQHQQNLASLPLGIVVLTSTSWPRIQTRIAAVQRAVARVKPGRCLIVKI
jgi:hypothetical protein